MRRPWRERRGGGKRGRRVLGESRSRVVPPRNHRRRRPLVWKNDSSVLTECPCFCPPQPLRSPYGGGWGRGGPRGLAPATWVEKRGGWRRERGRRDACSRFPYRRGTVVCAFMKICQTLLPSLFLALSLSPLHLFPLPLSSFPRLLCRGCCGPRCNDVSCI